MHKNQPFQPQPSSNAPTILNKCNKSKDPTCAFNKHLQVKYGLVYN